MCKTSYRLRNTVCQAVFPCRFYFNHFLARTPLAFCSLISLREAAKFQQLPACGPGLGYDLQAAKPQQQYVQQLQKLSRKQTVKVEK